MVVRLRAAVSQVEVGADPPPGRGGRWGAAPPGPI